MRILVTGAKGFLGKHLVMELSSRGHEVLLTSSVEYNLLWKQRAEQMLFSKDPDCVVHLAAKVGGIGANRAAPAQFFHENLQMGLNMLEAVRLRNDALADRGRQVKLVQIGTVCGYPKHTPVPFKEMDLWNGYPEETNAPYGIAKRALIQAASFYREQYGMNVVSVVPTNLYGPGDSLDLEKNHVVPALVRKCLEAKAKNVAHIDVWGSGEPTRDFLYVTDAARGIAMAAENYNGSNPINLGSGREIPISSLLDKIMRLTEYSGTIVWNRKNPDGQPRRCLDISRAQELLGWKPVMPFEEGLMHTVDDIRRRLAEAPSA